MSAANFARKAALGLGLGLCLAFIGCSSNPKPLPKLDGGDGRCLVNSDCSDLLVCAFERCHEECVTTRDCDGTLRCVGAHATKRVCLLPEEATCKTAADCQQGFVCSQDGACRETCAINADCVEEQLCVRGVCAEPRELNDAGELEQTLSFESCASDTDCADGQRCLSRTCQPECRQDRDCAAGETCEAGACKASTDAPACTKNTDCSEPGQSCVSGSCLDCACAKDIDCAAGETCDGCACQAPPAPECRWDLDCELGKRCISGSCDWECKEDRDCAHGQVCNGGICRIASRPTVVHDATITNVLDLQLMQGIEEVEGTLTLVGDLANTQGLESLRKVGSLSLYGWRPTYGDNLPEPLAGLANLTEITDTLELQYAKLTQLSFNSKLSVGKTVWMEGVDKLTCADIDAFRTAIDFSGSLVVTISKDCPGACDGAACAP